MIYEYVALKVQRRAIEYRKNTMDGRKKTNLFSEYLLGYTLEEVSLVVVSKRRRDPSG